MNNIFSYIHIPFCTSKCKYCRFASFGSLESLKVNLYVEKLLDEITKSKSKSSPFLWTRKGAFLQSLYFGWWTPSILSIIQLNNIIKKIKNIHTFSEDIEINIEATPITINEYNLKWWHSIWINRISCWIQTLNNDSLLEIWRWKKWDIINALDSIKKYLSKNKWDLNMSVDFIVGLPYVKKWEIKINIEYILKNYNFIKHISVYMLEEYYDIPEEIDSKFENIIYPNNWNKLWIKDDEYLNEYSEIKEFLKIKGFNSYEISSFAKVWYECKHNKSYWNHSEVLAFWLWAHGFIDNTRYSNAESFKWYYSWKKDLEEKLSANDLFLEKVMFLLRTSWLTEDIYNQLDSNKLEEFIKEWYLEKKLNKESFKENKNTLDSIITLSDKGVLVLDYLLREII